MPFLKNAKKRVETVTVSGEKIQIRRVTIGEAIELHKKYPDRSEMLIHTMCLVCTNQDGENPTPEEILAMDPIDYQILAEAINKFNSPKPGN